MRRTTPTFLALAGFAVLLAASATRASGQTPPNPGASATITGEDASKTGAALGTPCPALVSGATMTSVVGPVGCTADPGGTAAAKSSATVTPPPTSLPGDNAGKIVVHADADGVSGPTPVSVDAFGVYYRYFAFDCAGTCAFTKIRFTVTVLNASVQSDDPNTLQPTVAGEFAWGKLTTGDAFGPEVGPPANYSLGPPTDTDPLVGSGDTFFRDIPISGGVGTLGGATSFYYRLLAAVNITIPNSDPAASADITILDPVVTFLTDGDTPVAPPAYAYAPSVPTTPITGTPEPASIVLFATGLVGVAGFARRTRQAAKAS